MVDRQSRRAESQLPQQLDASASLPIILDVEASGFGRGSYPIEIGLAFPDGKTECFLIRPFADWQHWDTKAEGVHGIKRSILQEKGRDPIDVAKLLNQKLQGLTVYSDGWSVDNAWVAQLFDRAEMFQRFRIESLRKIITETQLEGWKKAKQDVIFELGLRRHRASSDALILLKTMAKLVNGSYENSRHISKLT